MNTAAQPTQSSKRSALRILDLVQASALSVCVGVVFTTGVAAAVAFPMMRNLDPSLPSFESVSDHWLIAAGSIMARIFNIAATIEGAALIVAALALMISISIAKAPKNRIALFIRVGLLALTMAIYIHYRAVLTPRMNGNFSSFLAAAQDHDTETAQTFREAFGADHPTSSKELGAIGLLSLLSAISVGLPITRRRESET